MSITFISGILEHNLENNRQRLWVAFVWTRCAKWSPTATSRLCSQYFNADDFESPFTRILGTDFVSPAGLKKHAVPSIHHQKDPEPEMADSRSTRKHRSVIRGLLKEKEAKSSEETEKEISTTSLENVAFVSEPDLAVDFIHHVEQSSTMQDASSQTPECLGCKKLSSQNHQLCNKIIDLQVKIQDQETEIQQQKESLDTSMNRITSMEKIIVDNESILSSDEEMENTESNKDLCESELSSDDEEFEETQHTKVSTNSENKKRFPTNHLYWKKYKQDTVSKLKATGQNLVIAGDETLEKEAISCQRWDGSVPVSNSSNSNLSSPCASTPAIETASMRKITSQNTERSEDVDGAYSYRLIELSNLVSAFQPLHKCEFGGELKVGDDEAYKYGNSSVINIECSKCKVKIELQTSGNNSQAWKPQNAMDTNRQMVYSSMEMGVGREGMSVLCDIFNMPHPCHHKAWDNHVAALYEAHKQAVAEQLQKARDKDFLADIYKTDEDETLDSPSNHIDALAEVDKREQNLKGIELPLCGDLLGRERVSGAMTHDWAVTIPPK
ncbi:THAP domain-containing 2, partial [Paramuricea clavata]